jgi:hypothetical protein
MTRYRARAVLLLFGVLHLTACQAWQSVPLDAISPSQLIEQDQPDRVRVSGGGVLDLELMSPAVEDDQLVGAVSGASVPLEDITSLDVWRRSVRHTSFFVLVWLGAISGVTMLTANPN